MNSILFMILRRLRRPLILIIGSFAIATLGLTLMPGVDENGRVWYMSIFEAFYIISFTATTTGFGEIPYEYSQPQRMWLTFSIYFTVIPWFYAVGKIITLLQDISLRQAIAEARFSSKVSKLQEPFYVLCSYGQSASLLAKTLDEKGMRVVIIEQSQEHLNELELTDFKNVVLSLRADAQLPESLIKAGINHPLCSGVVTLTNNDDVNLAVAVAVKLTNAKLPVIARAERDDIAANMTSFGTDHVINPYTLFGDQLAMRVHALGTYLLHEWLTSTPGETLLPPKNPPRGKWVVCGYGRFGKAVVKNLEREHLTVTVVEAMPELTECEKCIVGSGTEAKTLLEAGIKEASGIVAGTDNDVNNLSIVMTAYEINPKLFLVIRKNKRHNSALFKKFNADITMQPTDIIAHECLAHLISPLLAVFLCLARQQSNKWANSLISQLVGVVGENVPETWALEVNETTTPAILDYLEGGSKVTLGHLLKDPTNRDKNLQLVPILLTRKNKSTLVPEIGTIIEKGDQVLLCGTAHAKSTFQFVVNNHRALNYTINNIEQADSAILRWVIRLKNS